MVFLLFFFINCLKMGGFSLLLFQIFMTFCVSMGRLCQGFAQPAGPHSSSHVCRLSTAGARVFTANSLLQLLQSMGFVEEFKHFLCSEDPVKRTVTQNPQTWEDKTSWVPTDCKYQSLLCGASYLRILPLFQ